MIGDCWVPVKHFSFSFHNETVKQRYWVIDGNEYIDRYFKNLTLAKRHTHKTWLEVRLTLSSISHALKKIPVKIPREIK